MIIQATQKFTRQTPRKIRLVANQVKDKKIADAIQHLGLIERRSSLVLLKTLRQAIANAINNHGFSLEELRLKNILVDAGPVYKRFQPVSRGRAHSILKRTSHVTVQLEKIEEVVQKEEKPEAEKKITSKTKQKK